MVFKIQNSRHKLTRPKIRTLCSTSLDLLNYLGRPVAGRPHRDWLGPGVAVTLVPNIEIARRQLRNETFAGKTYHNFQVQWSIRRLGVRAIRVGPGRAANSGSGTLFQAAQIRANHLRLAQGSGLGKDGVETKVAGILTVSNATYGEKNMHWQSLAVAWIVR